MEDQQISNFQSQTINHFKLYKQTKDNNIINLPMPETYNSIYDYELNLPVKIEGKDASRLVLDDNKSNLSTLKPWYDVGFFLISRLCKCNEIVSYVMNIYNNIDVSK